MHKSGDPPGEAGEGRGDRLRLELLYREHAAGLRRRIRLRVGSREEASDLVHEAFARLLRAGSLHRLREPEAFLGRILRNLLVDRARRLTGRGLHAPLDEELEVAVRPDQADAIEAEQMIELYRAAVTALPPRMREVFVLHRVEELGYKEIAARLGISVRTVEWHVAEAIVRISKALEGR